MQEFSLIERYCKAVGATHPETRIGVGDDAAVVDVPAGKSLVISVDTMVEEVHFFADTAPELIAHKLATVNLSDMAAMGATPKWATLALTIPEVKQSWLDAFFNSLNDNFSRYGVQLIGGDTTQGELCLSMQIMGLVNKDEAITRAGAKPEDDIYVSGVIGDAALAVASINGAVSLSEADLIHCRKALDAPVPQLELGQKSISVASAVIDISDGLVADLAHIARASRVSMQVDVDSLSLSDVYRRYLDTDGSLEYALSGGDDYQLAFSAAKSQRQQIEQISVDLALPITRIGRVTNLTKHPVQLTQLGKPFELKQSAGYQHFI